MAVKRESRKGCGTGAEGGCCRLVSLVGVDERGQMILPKEIREKARIKPGDKLALVAWEKADEICCLSLLKAEELGGIVKDLLGPMMADLAKKR
jgi:antitoxin PrlF